MLACLIIFGIVDRSLFPRKDIVSIPYVVVCTFGSCESLEVLTKDLENFQKLATDFLLENREEYSYCLQN